MDSGAASERDAVEDLGVRRPNPCGYSSGTKKRSLVSLPVRVWACSQPIHSGGLSTFSYSCRSPLELTRFRGHLSSWEEECHDAAKTIEIRA